MASTVLVRPLTLLSSLPVQSILAFESKNSCCLIFTLTDPTLSSDSMAPSFKSLSVVEATQAYQGALAAPHVCTSISLSGRSLPQCKSVRKP